MTDEASLTNSPTRAEAPTPAQPAASSTNDSNNNSKQQIAKLAAQVKKLNEANVKYKNLLKMAKERIEQGEEELDKLRADNAALQERMAAAEERAERLKTLEENSGLQDRGSGGGGGTNSNTGMDLTTSNTFNNDDNSTTNIVRVCQRVKVPFSFPNANGGNPSSHDQIWALMDLEVIPNTDFVTAAGQDSAAPAATTVKRIQQWKRFDTESELQDFIRRDTGEPVQLPPYSLSPEQSLQIQQEAAKQVSVITEEFRRFRVKSELARKQADAVIRDLQANHVQKTARQILQDPHSHNNPYHSTAASSSSSSFATNTQLEQLKAEMAAQEAQWKEAYDMLLAENNALKSAGSEALLAAQWRQRYETAVAEKEDYKFKLQLEKEKAAGNDDNAKYELKYRDLKESFRLYRKKAKEIFESQQQHNKPSGGGAGSGPGYNLDQELAGILTNNSAARNKNSSSSGGTANTTSAGSNSNNNFYLQDTSSAESRLSYLKNLMVNYLTAEESVREHMEMAIGTVLQFSSDDLEKIEKKKAENESWF